MSVYTITATSVARTAATFYIEVDGEAGAGAMDFTVYASDGTTVVEAVSSSDSRWSASTITLTGFTANTSYIAKLDSDPTVTTSFTTLTDNPKAATESQWEDLVARVKTAGSGYAGMAKVLTTDDYNYPTTGTKTAVAPYLLEPGLYFAGSNVNLRIGGSTLQGGTFLVGANGGSIKKVLLFGSTNGSISSMAFTGINLDSSGREISKEFINYIEDSLTSSRADLTLSAKQGKVLKDLIDSLAIRGAGAPTTSTAGQVGTLYEDTTNGDLYICTDATNPYVWVEVGAGGGGSGVTELTSADYNWPTNNPTGVAVWLLDEGIYSANGINIWSINTGVSTASDWLLVVAKKATISSGDGDGIVYHFPTGAEAFIRKGYRTDGSGATAVNMGVNVVQTAGNNQWDVMSQNAVTSMVFADPSIRQKIRIGDYATAGNYAIAIGGYTNGQTNASGNYSTAIGGESTASGTASIAMNGGTASGPLSIALKGTTNANAKGSIAIGIGAVASTQGEMNIGVGGGSAAQQSLYGYNGSKYRLLTGLYDPQSAHDAATKGYVDSVAGGIINGGTTAPTTATVGAVGTLYSYVDTTGATPTPHLMVCTVADTVTPSYTWVEAGGGGGSVETYNDSELEELWEGES